MKMHPIILLMLVMYAAVAVAADKTLLQIRSELESDPANAVLYAQVNGARVALSPAERSARLDQWAQTRFDAQSTPVPAYVTRRQLHLELSARGLLTQVEPAIAAQLLEPVRSQALIEWKEATVYERSHAAVAAIGQILSLTSAELDDIWRAAAVR